MPDESIEQQKKKLREIIIKDAYSREKIVLSSGKTSDYYIDARRITLSTEGAYLCASLILDKVKGLDIDAIGGPTLGADPLIGAINVLGHQQGRSFKSFIIRKEAKAHGRSQLIEGPPLKEGSKVVIIDDVATTGKAFIHSLDCLSKMKIKVLKAVCIVDRDEGAKEAVAQKGCELISIFKAGEIHKP